MSTVILPDGNTTQEEEWKEINSTKNYSLTELAPEALYSGTAVKTSGKETKDISIQFKKKATASNINLTSNWCFCFV